MRLSPTQFIVRQFGGVRAAARVIGRSPSAVSQWQTRGGTIPSSVHKTILTEAKKRRIDISADDLIFGRSIAR